MWLFTNCSCYSACIRVLPLYPFDLPYFSSQPRKVTICGRHEMASVQDIKDRWGTSCALPCLLCYETSLPLQKLRRYGFHVLRYCMGHAFNEYILRSYRNRWMDCRDTFHACVIPATKLSTKQTGLSVFCQLIIEACASYILSCKAVCANWTIKFSKK